MDDIMVIGIAGGSGSGKTTITNQIVEQLGADVTVITHDNYYRAHHEMTYDERCLLNYDHPDSYETELLTEHLAALRRGESVEIPTYDFSIHDRTDETITVRPSSVIIVEGILLFFHPELRDLMDIKVFVDCDADVRILRRIMRDVRERGRTLESVINQYLATVKPMHEAFVEPSKRFADIIIPTSERNPVALDMLVNRIQAHLG
ncbi:MAG: uridine kinase [Atopobiaceae bacterium]|nr:uridine kinase [Atopobiaceae bacterium]MBR3315075.1 uridine kinase [Atopobiaceae bacterium]